MTVREINVQTGKETSRPLTAQEQADAVTRTAADRPTPTQRKAQAVRSTETPAQMADILEDLIDHITNGTPLSQDAKDWAADRATRRANA